MKKNMFKKIITASVSAAILSFALMLPGGAQTEALAASKNNAVTVSAAASDISFAASGTKKAAVKPNEHLFASDERVWINKTGTIELTIKNHTKGTKVELVNDSKDLMTLKKGSLRGETMTIRITALGTGKGSFTVKYGTESVKITVYLQSGAKLDDVAAYAYAHDAIVEVKTYDAHGNIYIGTGFFVGDKLVITAAHVVGSASKIELTDLAGHKYTIDKVLGFDEDINLALFSVKENNEASLTITNAKPVGGQKIYFFGSPSGLTGSFAVGNVSNTKVYLSEDDNNEFVQLTLPTGIGSGGGPAIDAQGKVIAMMTMKPNDVENACFAIPAVSIRRFLKNPSTFGAITVGELYKMNAGKTKESNDHHFIVPKESVPNTAQYEASLKVKTPEQIYAMAYEAMVDITIYTYDDIELGTGSGFFIADDIIVTNHHVAQMEDAQRIVIRDYHKNEYEVLWPIKTSQPYDVSILTVRSKKGKTTHAYLETLPGYIPEGGEVVYGMGSPRGLSAHFVQGNVSYAVCNLDPSKCDDMGVAKDEEFIQTTMPTTPGISGGPLFNKFGYVIGINSIKFLTTENQGMALRIENLAKAK